MNHSSLSYFSLSLCLAQAAAAASVRLAPIIGASSAIKKGASDSQEEEGEEERSMEDEQEFMCKDWSQRVRVCQRRGHGWREQQRRRRQQRARRQWRRLQDSRQDQQQQQAAAINILNEPGEYAAGVRAASWCSCSAGAAGRAAPRVQRRRTTVEGQQQSGAAPGASDGWTR